MTDRPLAAHIVSSIHEVDAPAWDKCAGDENPFVRHAFLAALEDSGSATAETGWLAQHYDGKLYGELVMRALRGHEDRTPVTLEVRYSLSAARGDRDYSMQFNSASPGKLRSGTTCRTNHVLEENVVAALRGL